MISQECSLVTLFKWCSQNFDCSKNMAAVGGGGGGGGGERDFLHYMDIKKFLKNLLLGNHWSEFGIISQDCSLCDPFQKLFTKYWSVEKHGCHGGRLFFIVWNSEKFFKILLLKLLVRFWNNFIEIVLGWPFQKLFAKVLWVNKHGISKWGLLALYKHIEILVNSSLKPTKKLAIVISKIHVRVTLQRICLFWFKFFYTVTLTKDW